MLPSRDFKSLASAYSAITAKSLEAPPRLELGVRVLQTRALPLGYGATPGFADCFDSIS